ncbi:MAG TPA: hypothetical protein VFB92_25290 [Vicinamibacterales bacterium]|nr:hypothetical protein [Vicinamibacterales bacterium]
MTMDYGQRSAGLTLILAFIVAIPQAQTTPQVSLSATTANVGQPGSPVNIKLLRWSTDEERAPIVAALNPPPAPPPPAAAPPPAAEAPPAAAPAPAAPPTDAAPAGAERGGAARGRAGGRGGRGGGRGGRGDAAAPISPIAALTGAISKAPTIGYIWTDEVTGYSIKYAWRAPIPAGGERIILATTRALGAQSPQWKPTGSEPATDYEFTVIELRLNAKGLGEGKTSLTSKVIIDNDAKTIALENYAAAPVILQNVKRS